MPIDTLPANKLRWQCPRPWLDFGTTAELDTSEPPGVQQSAAEALKFGLEVKGFGQNVFVRALPGTGRLGLVRRVLEKVKIPGPPPDDHCFVHNFSHPDSPRLLSVDAGRGPALQKRVDEMIRFIVEDLADLLSTPQVHVKTQKLHDAAEHEIQAISAPFEAHLDKVGLALAQLEDEDGDQETLLLPTIEGQPVPFEKLHALAAQGAVDPEKVAKLQASAHSLTAKLRSVTTRAVRVRKRMERSVRELVLGEVRSVLSDAVADIRTGWPRAQAWLSEVIEDVTEHLGLFAEHPAITQRYKVHVLTSRNPDETPPVVVELVPTVQRLLGGVDPVVPVEAVPSAPHLGIHAGSLLRADGGVLIIDAREIAGEPGAWAALKRALRTGVVQLTPPDNASTTLRIAGIKPEPIPVRVKVVLLGEPVVYYVLDETDADFDQLFKVLVDLDEVIERDKAGAQIYAQFVARLQRKEGLSDFSGGAVAALVDHGARIAEEKGKLTTRFGRIADIVREAAYYATKRGAPKTHREDIEHAILAGKQRADQPGRRFRERVDSGVIRVCTTGTKVGQLNGLAVIQAGPLRYGFPSRITASVGPGIAGAIHVEREAHLSGHIHTKGFFILRGLLRNLLDTPHPLVFDASLTHEQSYGGIDGDSASGAEFVCLLSALNRTPVRQGLAMTGAIDQHGNILPIGAVNEKIEGFFDTCAHAGLDGTQGVLIPSSNVGDLQLRRDVVEACRAGRFHVWGVSRIQEALALFTGREVGEPRADGTYPEETLLAEAVGRARVLWQATNPETP